jgi:hypothetical protein
MLGESAAAGPVDHGFISLAVRYRSTVISQARSEEGAMGINAWTLFDGQQTEVRKNTGMVSDSQSN